jgi:hypothetical protein
VTFILKALTIVAMTGGEGWEVRDGRRETGGEGREVRGGRGREDKA